MSDTTREPVAWAALREDGDIAWVGYTPEGAADGACGRQIVPLFRQPQPTLTDAEREALEFFGSGSDRAAARELLTLVSSLAGPDGLAELPAQNMAELLEDFHRHGDVVCNLLARHGAS